MLDNNHRHDGVTAAERWQETHQLVGAFATEYRHLDADGIYEKIRAQGHQVDRDEVRAAFEAV